MTEYRLLTIWRIEAPLDQVYAAVLDAPRWPDWWSDVQKVELLAAGDATGIGSVLRYFWHGHLPYRMAIDVRVTRIEKQVAIEGSVAGDLAGIGRWQFSHHGAVTVVRHEWHVRSTRWWMKLFAPLARSLFIRNHGIVMRHGAEGLAQLLDADLVGLEHIDLLARHLDPDQGRRTGADDRRKGSG